MSQSLLFVNSTVSLDENGSEEDNQTTATMLVLMNAVAECRNKNIKKALVEFNESYIATHNNDDLFTSKLLELNYADLELLYQSICASEKNRRSSKQHEKKLSSFKKKTSVGDSSFANAAFEGEMRSGSSSSSLGRKRSQVSLNEEIIQGKACLRKAYKLSKDISNSECQNTRNEAFENITTIHLKVENFYSCAVLCVEHEEKFTVESFICTLDDVQNVKISEVCLLIASKETSGCDIDCRIKYSKLAVKLQPNSQQAAACLCNLYRLNNETEKAFSTVKIFLEEINPNEENLILLQMICLTDTSKYSFAKTCLEGYCQKYPSYKQLNMILSVVLVLCGEVEAGIQFIDELEIHTDKERKKTFASVLKLLKAFNLQKVVNEFLSFVTKMDENAQNLQERKELLSLVARILAYQTPNDVYIAKLYVDCLYLCGELDIAQDFLIKLVKDHPKETLPMVYLANIRLKASAFVASTEDFRALLKVYGEENLITDLAKLPMEERVEIARVHRLHGARFLANELAFREAAECFTVVICALGSTASGLYLSRGYCYMHMNDFKAAETDFNHCVEKEDLITAALCARAVLYAVTTHVEEALRDFKNAFRTDPVACQKCLPKLPFEHVTVFSQMIIQFIKQGIETATLCNKKLNDISEISVMETCLKPSINSSLDNDILGYCEFLCKVFPSNVDYISTYIECLYIKHIKITMKIAVDRALAAFPNEPRFEIWKGVFLSEQRKLDEAIECIRNICDQNDDTLHILTYFKQKTRKQIFERSMKKGRKALEKENFEVAISYFTLASSLSTNNVIPLKERLDCFSKTGDQVKWLADLDRILALDPTAELYCTRAVYKQQQGENLSACDDYIQALDAGEGETMQFANMNGNLEDITGLFYTTALCMCEMNKTRTVARLCETGLRFDPHHKGMRTLIEKSPMNRCTIQ